MLSYDEYNSFCRSLPATTHVVQWGGAHVWKVGSKVFAIAGWSKGEQPFITFKCSGMAFEILREQPGLRPAPYLAPRGGKWIQMNGEPGLDDDAMKDYIAESHRLISLKLTKKLQAELGLNQSDPK
jgi:predicted DNA-binding protein (MmcQ/YjbR family)